MTTLTENKATELILSQAPAFDTFSKSGKKQNQFSWKKDYPP
jgi:hypothetical protein